LFPEKYSFAYYHPRSVEKRKRLNERAKALQREQEYLDEMPLAQRFPSHQRKSHGTKIQTEALNQHPNLRSIKITLNPSSSFSSSQIRRIDNPLNDLTYDQTTDAPLFDGYLETEFDTVEQNFDPTHLANNDNKQFPRLIHTQTLTMTHMTIFTPVTIFKMRHIFQWVPSFEVMTIPRMTASSRETTPMD